MCVAVVKRSGIDMPSKEILQKCFKANPHGSGFAYVSNNTIRIEKGFMTFDKFYNALCAHHIRKETPAMLHFRIATSGKVDGGNCHPFPLVQDFREMRKCNAKTDCAIVHNGIMPIHVEDNIASDTMEFVKTIAGLGTVKKAIKGIASWISGGNKVAAMTPEGNIELFGDWKDKDGVIYSNLSWDYSRVYNPMSYNSCLYDNDYDVAYISKPRYFDGGNWKWSGLYYDKVKWAREQNKCYYCGADMKSKYKIWCPKCYQDRPRIPTKYLQESPHIASEQLEFLARNKQKKLEQTHEVINRLDECNKKIDATSKPLQKLRNSNQYKRYAR